MEIYFRRVFTEQMAIQHQFGGVFLLVDTCLQLAVNGAIAYDRPDVHGPR